MQKNSNTEFSPLRLSLLVQMVVLACITLVAWISGKEYAYSVALGAIVYIIPNLYFTYYAFRYKGAQWAPWIKQSFMWGHMGKLSLAAVGFALIFKFVKPLQVEALFAGFLIMIFVQWGLGRKIANAVQA